jgi:hypothetical protein
MEGPGRERRKGYQLNITAEDYNPPYNTIPILVHSSSLHNKIFYVQSKRYLSL